MKLILEVRPTNPKGYKYAVEIPALRTRDSWFSTPHEAIDVAMSTNDFQTALSQCEEEKVFRKMKLTVEVFRAEFDKFWKSHVNRSEIDMNGYYDVKLGRDKCGDDVVVILSEHYSANIGEMARVILRRLSVEHGPDVTYRYYVIHPSQYKTYCEMTGFREERENPAIEPPCKISLMSRPYDNYMRVYIDSEASATIIDKTVVMQWLAMQGVKLPK